jgi:hypothetical protein
MKSFTEWSESGEILDCKPYVEYGPADVELDDVWGLPLVNLSEI